MNNRSWLKSLTAELLATILAVAVICFALFFGLRGIAWSMVDARIRDVNYIKQQTDKASLEFQTYISRNNVKSWDTEKISKWIKSHRDITFIINAEDMVYYDIYGSMVRNSTSDMSEITDEYNAYAIEFSDGSYTIYIYGFFGMSYYLYSEYALALACMVIFFLVIGICIRQKIKYIKLINNSIGIMEGGDLDYEVPIKGHDELTEVAVSLNSMSRTMKEQIKAEEEARQSNHKLITAVSHDLRTPLTAQIGYLEIIKKCSQDMHMDDKVKLYIEKCMASSMKLKEMSDDMFEYFLVSSPDTLDLAVELDAYEAPDIFVQGMGEGTALLEDKGYEVKINICEERGMVRLSIKYFLRITDNIISNIIKYADQREPVFIHIDCDSRYYNIEVINAVKRDRSMEQSTGIGTKSMDILTKRMNGTVEFKEAGGQYIVLIKIPKQV